MEVLENYSPLSTVREITPYDHYALGKMFEQFTEYKNEAGASFDLGRVPTLAYDILTVSYGTSIAPIIASIQPIEEETGNIYYKEIRAVDARGNVAANSIIRTPLSVPDVYMNGYANETVTQSTDGAGNPLVVSNGTLIYITATTPSGLPIRPGTVKLSIPGLGISGFDDRAGNLLAKGVADGVVNYDAGTIQFELSSDPAITVGNPTGSYAYSLEYATDFETTGRVPRINMQLTSTGMAAEIFALTTDISMFKSYAFKKRFGRLAEDELVNDLSNEITAEIGNAIVARLYAAAATTIPVVWNRARPTGVPWTQHKLEFLDRLADLDTKILNQAGRGGVSALILGNNLCTIMNNMPNFEKASIQTNGPALYGMYNGNIAILRAPALPANEGLAIFKGTTYFDAACVYSPYMPLYIGNTIPSPQNILKTAAVAAVWAGIKVVVPNFIAKIQVIDSPESINFHSV